MTENNDRINQLLEQLELLLKRQEDFSKEINQLRIEVNKLKAQEQLPASVPEQPQQIEPIQIRETKIQEEIIHPKQQPVEQQFQQKQSDQVVEKKQPATKSDLEKFIGENLISKIGIAITILGVAIGAKYSIENNLISPLTRIILGYLTGLGLLGVGIRLKNKYESYSAVLVSGSMSIMYFITYAAYSFYNLFPQIIAFFLMIVFTVFTVIAAISYNRQVIAHIGLVGAYAIPFLLSEGSGKVGVLFIYMTILNAGILVISFLRNWKPLVYSAFGLTWVIYFFWYLLNYRSDQHFALAFFFLAIFFILFYITLLVSKFLRKEPLKTDDVLLILWNVFLFFGIGYNILSTNKNTVELLGLFTLGNGIIHFIVSFFIYKRNLGDRNLLYLTAGMVLVFITIAVPVQLDGNWVTLLWTSEATLLFWVGRNKGISIYEKLSYPLMLLSFISLVHDWSNTYTFYVLNESAIHLKPLFNSTFLTSLLVICAFAFIVLYSRNKNNIGAFHSQKEMERLTSIFTLSVLITTLYFAFRLEISNYCNQLYIQLATTVVTESMRDYETNNYNLLSYKPIWIINYSLVFFALCGIVNFRFLKDKYFGIFNLSFIAVAAGVFLLQGLYVLSDLRENYLYRAENPHYEISTFNIWIRYISLSLFALTVFVCYRYTKQKFMKPLFQKTFDFCLHACCLWIGTSELIHWMDLLGAKDSYKLGISILWGIYSLFLIILGIWKGKRYLRIIAIVLFGVTLLKLFFYDIAHLNTIAKTIVFVSLGVLLLIISFLYNKYKHVIFHETEH